MPAYNSSGFQRQLLLSPGQPGYSLGNYNDLQPFTKFLVTEVGVTSDVANIQGLVVEGPIPSANQFISIVGTQSNSGALNVVNATITAANVNNNTGVGILNFAVTTPNLNNNTVDGGVAIIKQLETGDTIPSGNSANYAGQAFAVPAFIGLPNQERSITWMYKWQGAGVNNCTIALEGAIRLSDFDAGLQKTLDSGTNNANNGGETRTITGSNAVTINFIRINVSAYNAANNALLIGKIIL